MTNNRTIMHDIIGIVCLLGNKSLVYKGAFSSWVDAMKRMKGGRGRGVATAKVKSVTYSDDFIVLHTDTVYVDRANITLFAPFAIKDKDRVFITGATPKGYIVFEIV